MLLRLISIPISNHSLHKIGELYMPIGAAFHDGSTIFQRVRRVKTGKEHIIQARRFMPAETNKGDD